MVIELEGNGKRERERLQLSYLYHPHRKQGHFSVSWMFPAAAETWLETLLELCQEGKNPRELGRKGLSGVCEVLICCQAAGDLN